MAHVSTVVTRPTSPFSAVSSSNSSRIVFKRDSLNGLTASVNNVPVEWVGPSGRTRQLDPRLADQSRQNLRLIPVPGFDDKPIRYTVEVRGGLLGGGGCVSGEEGAKNNNEVTHQYPNGNKVIERTLPNRQVMVEIHYKSGVVSSGPKEKMTEQLVSALCCTDATTRPASGTLSLMVPSKTDIQPKKDDSPSSGNHSDSSGRSSTQNTPPLNRYLQTNTTPDGTPPFNPAAKDDSPKSENGTRFDLPGSAMQAMPSATPLSTQSSPQDLQKQALEAAEIILKAVNGEVKSLSDGGLGSPANAMGVGLTLLRAVVGQADRLKNPLAIVTKLVEALSRPGMADQWPLGQKEALAQHARIFFQAVSNQGKVIGAVTQAQFAKSVGEALQLAVASESKEPTTRLRRDLEILQAGVKNHVSTAESPYVGLAGQVGNFLGALSDRKFGDALVAAAAVATGVKSLSDAKSEKVWYKQVLNMSYSAAAAASDITHLNTLQGSFIEPNVVGSAYIDGNEHTVSAGVRALGDLVRSGRTPAIQTQAWEGTKDQPLTGVKGYLGFNRSWWNSTNAAVRCEAVRTMIEIAHEFKDAKTEPGLTFGREAAVALLTRRAVEKDETVKAVFEHKEFLEQVQSSLSQGTYSRYQTEVDAAVTKIVIEVEKRFDALQAKVEAGDVAATAELKALQAESAAIRQNGVALAKQVTGMAALLSKVDSKMDAVLAGMRRLEDGVKEVKKDTRAIKTTTEHTDAVVTGLATELQKVMAELRELKGALAPRQVVASPATKTAEPPAKKDVTEAEVKATLRRAMIEFKSLKTRVDQAALTGDNETLKQLMPNVVSALSLHADNVISLQRQTRLRPQEMNLPAHAKACKSNADCYHYMITSRVSLFSPALVDQIVALNTRVSGIC